jgi:hypothetical protein
LVTVSGFLVSRPRVLALRTKNLALSSNALVQTNVRPLPESDRYLAHQSSVADEIGIAQYPGVSYLPEATERLLKEKASSWLLARVYHTDGSIEDVIKYFKAQGQKTHKPTEANTLVKSLLRDNWEIRNGDVRYAPDIFGVGSELRKSASAENVQTSLGVIVLDDSIVRVHLISPHPASADSNKITPGTMIILIRERITQPAESARNERCVQNDKVYNIREVTRKAHVKFKPEPETSSRISGTIRLSTVFSASGKVTNIRAVTTLPDGLTEAAIKAASKISFDPAIKDGCYVSVYMILEYNFN